MAFSVDKQYYVTEIKITNIDHLDEEIASVISEMQQCGYEFISMSSTGIHNRESYDYVKNMYTTYVCLVFKKMF